MSSSLPTEMTIRNFLSKELEKREVKVYTEWSYTTPIGRLVPDMRLLNGAEYVVETKLGAEAKLLDAIVKLYDYSKYTDAKGSFAVLFPEELRHPWTPEILERIAFDPKLKYVVTAIFKDNRPSSRYEGNLASISEWIALQVLKPPVIEVDTGFAIKVLTEAVEAITICVKSLKGKDLEEIFGGKNVFENILQYEEGHYPLDEMKQAATYLLVNQIIFYHVLSAANKNFEPIDETKIKKPVDLLRYFDPVLKVDYASVFGFDVASKLSDSATNIITIVIVAVKALAPEKIAHDVLGKVFHDLIPFNIRKAVAAFYTNNETAEILATLAIEKPNATVMDLACGSGTLLVAAYRRKRELLTQIRQLLPEDHKKFLEHDLTGVDIMPFAAHLAVMHLSLQSYLSETDKVRIAVWDSTELKPNMSIPAIDSELKEAYRKPTLDMFKEHSVVIPSDARIKKGAITLEGVGGQSIPLEKVDLVIMNPPFTRQERLPKEYKDALSKRLGEYKSELSGQLGLWGYFLLLGDRFVKENGRMALVFPSRPLGAKSAKGIRKFILSHYSIEFIVSSWERLAFSESTLLREVLLVLRKKLPKEENGGELCRIINVKSLPRTLEEADSFAQNMKAIKTDYENKRLKATIITQDELAHTIDNWFIHIASFDPQISKQWVMFGQQSINKLLPFKDYIRKKKIEVIRGVETRGNFGFQFYEAFVVREPQRAMKNHDQWFSEESHTQNLLARNRFTN